MLKDRKLLVEKEIETLTTVAAHQYFDAIRSGDQPPQDYDIARERITDLQHQLKMIQLLIDQGHE